MGKLLKYVPGILFLSYIIGMLLVLTTPILAIFQPNALNTFAIWTIWGVSLVLGIGAFYDELYEDIRNRTSIMFIFPGKLKHLFNIAIAMVMICFGITCALVSKGTYTDSSSIQVYKNYYNATETLLDSLGVDVDSPILESDVGAKYLETKSEVDKYEPEQ